MSNTPVVPRSPRNVVLLRSKDGKSFTPYAEMSRRAFEAQGGAAKLTEVCTRAGIFFSVIGPKGVEATNA